jgi:ribosomal-protein-alanine N-acetyltransferase
MRTATTNQIDVHIRWMIRRDMPDVLAIEQACFQWPWGEEDFIRCLRQRNCIGKVAEHKERVVGFMVYELHANRLHLLNLAVHEDCRFKGVGASLVGERIKALTHDRRSRIMCEVRETNLDAQLFFRRIGFRCVSVLREFYQDTPESAYLFQYRHSPGA